MTYSLFEKGSLIQSQGVGLCNDGHYINYFGELFKNHNVELILRQHQTFQYLKILFDSQVSKCGPWG